VTLYERRGCWKCIEVREVLERLGLPYEALDVRDPEAARRVAAATGQRHVPVLRDGSTWVWDRRRIIRYLEETYGGAPPAEAELPAWMGGIATVEERGPAGRDP